MIRLIDRASGRVLGEVSLTDFQLMRSVLTDEDLFDADYYVNADTLDLLVERGLGASAEALLHAVLAGVEGLDFGWELPYGGMAHSVSGRVVDEADGSPVPGLKVEAYDGGDLLGWSFTRADGTFEVELGGPGVPGVWEAQPLRHVPDLGLEILALDHTVLLSTPSEPLRSERRSYGDLEVCRPWPPDDEDDLEDGEEAPSPDPAVLDQVLTLDRPLEHPLRETGAAEPHLMEDAERLARPEPGGDVEEIPVLEIPERFRDLFEKPIFGHLATLTPKGRPQVNPIWFDVHEGHIRFNSALGRQKDKNIRVHPHVALSIQDPQDGYRYVEVRGEVVQITEEGADDVIDGLARKYLGVEAYPFRQPGEVRVTYLLRPDRFSSNQ